MRHREVRKVWWMHPEHYAILSVFGKFTGDSAKQFLIRGTPISFLHSLTAWEQPWEGWPWGKYRKDFKV